MFFFLLHFSFRMWRSHFSFILLTEILFKFRRNYIEMWNFHSYFPFLLSFGSDARLCWKFNVTFVSSNYPLTGLGCWKTSDFAFYKVCSFISQEFCPRMNDDSVGQTKRSVHKLIAWFNFLQIWIKYDYIYFILITGHSPLIFVFMKLIWNSCFCACADDSIIARVFKRPLS